MPTRNVVLTEYQSELVTRLVASGRYQNASEVMREGLRLVERQESEEEIRLKAMREAAAVGIADISAGTVPYVRDDGYAARPPFSNFLGGAF